MANVLITGASSGIGAELARAYARRGDRVAIVARREDRLRALAAELSAHPIVADLTSAEAAAVVVASARAALGPLDVVIANAGVSHGVSARRLTTRDVVPTLAVNVVGAIATLTEALPEMVARGAGRLVGISSIAGMRALPASAAYSASKAALSTFLAGLRIDLAGTGVRAIDVRPGFIKTEMTEEADHAMPFLLDADDAAARIVKAIDEGRPIFTFPTPMALAARVMTLLPRFAWEGLSGRFYGGRSPRR